MKITGLSVEGVGKFGAPVRVEGFGDGVNVLAAANEAGKSTLFRALRACLFKRHGATDKELKALATEGLALPVSVTLDFEHKGESYSLRKSFLKGSEAVLTRGQTAIAKNREADDQALEILGVRAGSGRSVDEGAFGLLWVDQGNSFKVERPTGDAGDLLTSAVQEEVGEMVGGDRARTVLAALSDELGKQLTSTGRPKKGGDLDTAETIEKDLQHELETVTAKLQTLDQQIDELQRMRAERERLADPGERKRLQQASEEAQAKLEKGRKAAAELKEFELAEQLADGKSKARDIELTRLRECAERIATSRKRQVEIEGELAELETSQTAQSEGIAKQQRDREGLRAQADEAERKANQLERLADARRRADERDTIRQRLDAIEDLLRRGTENERALRANPASEAAYQAWQSSEHQAAVCKSKLEAAAPQVSIELGQAADGQVTIDGNAVAADRQLPAIAPVTIRAGELATIIVRPQGDRIEQDREDLRQAESAVRAALDEIGAVDAAQALQMRSERRRLEDDRREVESELKARGVPQGSAAKVVEKLKVEVAEIDQIVEAAVQGREGAALPSAAQITTERAAVREELDELRRRRDQLDEATKADSEALSSIRENLAARKADLDTLRMRLQEDLATLPESDGEARIVAAQQARDEALADHRRKALALEAQREKTPTAEGVTGLERAANRLQEALGNHTQQLTDIEKQIAGLEGRIESVGGDGLGEKAEDLRQQLELAKGDRAARQARVDALSLLKSTIEECYAEQRERLHAPLHRHLQPYLNDVFPSGRLELGEEFTVTGLRRNGSDAEDLLRLSDGTQEQLAVLVRLAMGSLLAEQGHEAPIILDDALVFSDDDRIDKMFDALNRAGEKQQVIVLTCRTRTFATLGGRRLSIVNGA